ncbi:cell division protein CrgA [Pseudonocardia humida]|uniref:Cell division protein CrgA n=1 Tax=Pseudonocardia humida TaxID=2800819 RepID=A0ABT1A4V5_9PSEU|nr:cell division protein CrgA [Pseudonocardia humida]MCO1658020.1 cell division protein CrgA [Pseudonocardia humida]
MPKSKVRKKTAYTPPTRDAGGNRTPVKVKGPTHPVYIAVMLGLMLAGLAWLVVNYLAGDRLDFMIALGSWNFLIGFALIVIGLLMTMRWR